MPRRSATEFAVLCDDLSIARGGVRVVEGVSFRLSPGRALAVMGATGSGKSTLAALLAGGGRRGGGVQSGQQPGEVVEVGADMSFEHLLHHGGIGAQVGRDQRRVRERAEQADREHVPAQQALLEDKGVLRPDRHDQRQPRAQPCGKRPRRGPLKCH